MLHEQRKKQYFPIPGLPIGLWRMEKQRPTDLHDHEFTEVAIVEKGQGRHQFGDTILPVDTGAVFVIDRKCRHAWVEASDMTVCNIMIGSLGDLPLLSELQQHPAFDALFKYEPKLREQQKGRGRLHLDMMQLEQVTHIVNRMDRALHNNEQGHEISAKIQLLSLIDLLCNAYAQAPRKEHQTVLRVGRAIRKIEENWESPPAAEQLASLAHVSLATFYRLFKEPTNCTPAQYAYRLRIHKACKLLRRSDNSISEIACQVGFPDSNYFSRLFGREMGLSPRQYRRRNKRK